MSLVIYAIGAWIVVGAILMPLLRMGLFGSREGRYVWLEIFFGMMLIGLGMWFVVQYYQPSFF